MPDKGHARLFTKISMMLHVAEILARRCVQVDGRESKNKKGILYIVVVGWYGYGKWTFEVGMGWRMDGGVVKHTCISRRGSNLCIYDKKKKGSRPLGEDDLHSYTWRYSTLGVVCPFFFAYYLPL